MKKYALYGCGIAVVLFLAYKTFDRPKTIIDSQKTPYNLILISIDTVRADYLQIYNPQGARTPNLLRLAKEGFLFTNAISQVPFTLPSHCTMLTGTYPMKHGVQENIATRLADDSLTLAEVLKSRGYQTAGFIGALVLESGTGINQGFETFDDSFVRENKTFEDRSGIQKDAESVKRSFLRWMDRKNSAPFFSFIHFYDAHAPYNPPKPFHPNSADPKALYRGELEYVDSVIGEVVDELSRRQLLDQSIIVITGDHGEMLGEHGENGHGFFIYQEALHVPLLFHLPEKQSGSSNEVVQTVDLMPTILDLLEIPVPQSVQGHSFAKKFRGEKLDLRFAYSESLTAEQHFGAAPLHGIQDARYKYIDSPKPELYDLKVDATESNNLAAKQKDRAAQMKKALLQIVKANTDTSGKSAERELSPEKQQELAALGYISGSSTAPSNSNLDAKDCLASWNDLGKLSMIVKEPNCRECLELVENIRSRGYLPVQARIFAARAHVGLGDYRNAISILQDVLNENPKNAQAEMVLAHSYQKEGNADAALKIFRKLMDEEDSVLGMENFSELMILQNRKEELQRTIDQFVATKKITDQHYPVLGEIYLLLQQPERARQFLQKALEVSPENPLVYIHLSSMMDAEGKTAEAIQFLEQHRDEFDTADYLLQMGKLYGKTNNSQKEYETFVEMVNKYPNDPRGHFFLGKTLLERNGDMAQVIKLAETGLSLNPDPEFQPFGYFLLGDAYTAIGQTAKAQAYLKKAEELQARQSIHPK